jgi:hypothetical protein
MFAASKEAFIELLFRRSSKIDEIDDISSAPRDSYVILRFAGEQKSELPVAVLVLSGDLREFFAFTTTYAVHLRPLTAYMRVYDGPADFLRSAAVRELDVPLHYLAMVLIERVMTRTPRDPEFKEADAVAQCTATFGYVATLARLNGFPASSFDELESRWFVVQDRYAANLRSSSSAVLGFWSLVDLVDTSNGVRAAGPFGDVLEAARSYVATGSIDSFFWEAITRQLPEVRALPKQLAGVKERAVEPLNRSIHMLVQADHLDRTLREFLCGFLVSEFANHSFDYLPTALSILKQIPLAMFWFGLFSSRASDNNLLEFSSGFGRFIRARLSSEALMPPRADVAFQELWASEDLLQRNALRHTAESELLVELFEGIVTRARLRHRTEADAAPAATMRQMGGLAEDIQALERSTRAMTTKLDTLLPFFASSNGDQLQLLDADEPKPQGRSKRKDSQKRQR